MCAENGRDALDYLSRSNTVPDHSRVRLHSSYVEVRDEGQCIARHERCYGRQQQVLELEHYLDVLEPAHARTAIIEVGELSRFEQPLPAWDGSLLERKTKSDARNPWRFLSEQQTQS